MPGTAVEADRDSPMFGCGSLSSQKSMAGYPPPKWMTIRLLFLFFSTGAWARRALRKLSAVREKAPNAAACFRKCRRSVMPHMACTLGLGWRVLSGEQGRLKIAPVGCGAGGGMVASGVSMALI